MAAALDPCDLMTLVDTGEIYYAGESVKAPDYFLHLRSGRRILVDVKNIDCDTMIQLEMPIKFSSSEVARLVLSATASALRSSSLCTCSDGYLVTGSLADLVDGPGGGKRITIHQALMRDQLALLGRSVCGTASTRARLASRPLGTICTGDREGRATKRPVPSERGRDARRRGARSPTLRSGGSSTSSCSSAPGMKRKFQLIVDGELVEVRWQFTPDETHDGGKELLGTLASMYSPGLRTRPLATSVRLPSTSTSSQVALITLIPPRFDSRRRRSLDAPRRVPRGEHGGPGSRSVALWQYSATVKSGRGGQAT